MRLNQCMEPRYCVALYNFIKDNNIKKVVETGVCHGMSSFFILDALPDDGKLISIEPTILDLIPKEGDPKWQLIRNYSEKVLENVFKVNKDIDLFIHDSKHEYDHMKWEYEVAVKHCRYIASHDINHTGAGSVWKDLIKKYKLKEIYNGGKFGIVEKV